jgi:hypothetical protein
MAVPFPSVSIREIRGQKSSHPSLPALVFIRTTMHKSLLGLRKLFKSEIRNPKHKTNAKSQFLNSPNLHNQWFRISSFSHLDLFRISIFGFRIWLRLRRAKSIRGFNRCF